MKNGIGLYISGVWVLYASYVHKTSFCPRLSRRVKDSPQPKSFSPTESEKLAAVCRRRLEAVRTNEKGVGLVLTTLLESDKCWLRVKSLPEASLNSKRSGSRV